MEDSLWWKIKQKLLCQGQRKMIWCRKLLTPKIVEERFTELTLMFTFNLMMVWFSLCAIIFYFTKIKSFKYYAAYTLFLGLYMGLKLSGEYTSLNLRETGWYPNWYLQLLYNCLYFIFAASFLNLEKHLPRLNQNIRRTAY